MDRKTELWSTRHVAAIWFVIGFVYGFVRGEFDYDWNTGLEFLVSTISEGIGAGLGLAGIAALVSWGHNRNVIRSNRSPQP